MRFDVITIFPQMFTDMVSGSGVLARACDRGLLEMHFWNPSDYLIGSERVDAKSYGGHGMVMRAEPMSLAIEKAKLAGQSEGYNKAHVYVMSYRGKKLNTGMVSEFATVDWLILVCGRYEGIDQRAIDANADAEICVGETVLSGGELAAAVLIDSVSRQIPHVLHHPCSARDQDPVEVSIGGPVFTKPAVWRNVSVPQELLSGHHARIDDWRSSVNSDQIATSSTDLFTVKQE